MQGLLPLPGDLVWIRRRRWRVERAQRDRHVIRLDVAARDRRLTFLSPFDHIVSRHRLPAPRRVRPQYAIARLARLIAHADDVRIPSTAVDAIADILPHQLEPAMALLAGRARILIADDVGLGKTVQAGLMIAELVRRHAESRILVLAPAMLRDQWIDELSRRFRLTCLAADRPGLDASSRAGAYGDNPWQRPGVWIGSVDFLKQRHVMDSLPADPWDLVVIDEVHTVCGDSDRYDVCNHVARRSRRLVLLTATPHDGDTARFARLTELGRLDGGDENLTIFRRTRNVLGPRPARRVRWHRVAPDETESRVLDCLRAFERVVIARSGNSDQALLLLSVFRKRALSTMTALSQSLARRLAWLGEPGPDAALDWSQPRFAFDSERDDGARDEHEGLTAYSGLGSQQERSWLRRLRALATEAAGAETKVERVVALIHRSNEPVVVFTEFRDSLEVMLRRLRFSRPVSVLHGAQDAAERRLHLQRFLDGSTSILLATDVAGQGLNLQSRARWVISLELPWNPTRLEQRIGRVDRILQTRSTHFTLVVARDEAESGLLVHLARRILAARRGFSADAMAGVAPRESDVRQALLQRTGKPLHDAPAATNARQPQTEPIALTHRWARPARAVARALMRRRALAVMWRAAEGHAGGAVRSDRGRAQSLVPPERDALCLFSAPILDATGALIERRHVAIAIRADAGHRCDGRTSIDSARHRRLIDVARPAIVAALKRRVLITARFLRTAGQAARARARALARARRAELALDESQPGLFERREARAFEQRAADRARLLAGAETVGEAAEADALAVRAGDPVLEIVLERRR